MMKIYVANYTHSLDVECLLDDKYNIPAMMCHLLAFAAFVPVVSRDRDDALARIVAMLATEITDMHDPDDPDENVPAPTLETVTLLDDHEFSTPTTFVYAYDPDPSRYQMSARIVVTELTID